MRVGVFRYDDGTPVFDLVDVKGILMFLVHLNVLVEKTDIFFSQVFVLVVVFLFDQGLLQLMCPDPGKELHSEFSTLEDEVIEVKLNLLDELTLGISLQIAQFRVFHINITL